MREMRRYKMECISDLFYKIGKTVAKRIEKKHQTDGCETIMGQAITQ